VKTAAYGAIVIAVLLLALAVLALVERYKNARDSYDLMAADEADHEVRLAEPARHLTVVPDGFTCQRCGENPAMPAPSVWCAVCAPIVDQYPSEPIERGSLR
jgi:rubrerythrin